MLKIPSEIGVGTDLELFLFDNEKALPVPCVGILEGSKEKPFRPKGYGKGFAIQEDNVMVEFNIPPQATPNGFVEAVKKGRTMVLKELQLRHGTKYGLYQGSHSYKFTAAQLASRQAQTIGCEPDFDAYEGGKVRNNPPAPGLTRNCGGHVHLGGDFKCPDFVAGLFAELFIGIRGGCFALPSDPRSAWYGKPGLYRPKPYGIEYRTPNNTWSTDSYKMETVGAYAIRCARFLTESDAVKLQTAFRRVPWLKVRELMLEGANSKKGQNLWQQVITAAKHAGVPL